jgi:hypothetical protein
MACVVTAMAKVELHINIKEEALADLLVHTINLAASPLAHSSIPSFALARTTIISRSVQENLLAATYMIYYLNHLSIRTSARTHTYLYTQKPQMVLRRTRKEIKKLGGAG